MDIWLIIGIGYFILVLVITLLILIKDLVDSIVHHDNEHIPDQIFGLVFFITWIAIIVATAVFLGPYGAVVMLGIIPSLIVGWIAMKIAELFFKAMR